MFLTQQEIMDTPKALAQTVSYLRENEKRIKDFFANNVSRKFVFFGCGSSYMLAKSSAALFGTIKDTTACAIPAGGYIVNPDFWQEAIRGSIVVMLSRSGRTSEMVRAAQYIKENFGCEIISISMASENLITPMSGLDLVLDWCYDNSTCQTRTVTNLYATALYLAATYSGNKNLEAALLVASEQSQDFETRNFATLEKIAKLDWDNIVVLADEPVSGLAEEGSLAFTEICMLPGRYFHLLDYRHGPIVISGAKTLTIILEQPSENLLQDSLIQDVISHGGTVITMSEHEQNTHNSAAHIQIKGIADFAAWGIPFIYVAQMLALLKAIDLGVNPDSPTGLDPFIILK